MTLYEEDPDWSVGSLSILNSSKIINSFGSYTAEEFSKMYPFDIIFESIKSEENFVINEFLYGKKLREYSINDEVMNSIDTCMLAVKSGEKYKEKTHELIDNFIQEWNYFKNTDDEVKIDFKKTLEGDLKELTKLYGLCDFFNFDDSVYVHEHPRVEKILKSGVPLGFIFSVVGSSIVSSDTTLEGFKGLVELSSKYPETFYLPGKESAYDQDFVATFKACKARLKMEEMFSDDGLKSTKRKVV